MNDGQWPASMSFPTKLHGLGVDFWFHGLNDFMCVCVCRHLWMRLLEPGKLLTVRMIIVYIRIVAGLIHRIAGECKHKNEGTNPCQKECHPQREFKLPLAVESSWCTPVKKCEVRFRTHKTQTVGHDWYICIYIYTYSCTYTYKYTNTYIYIYLQEQSQ